MGEAQLMPTLGVAAFCGAVLGTERQGGRATPGRGGDPGSDGVNLAPSIVSERAMPLAGARPLVAPAAGTALPAVEFRDVSLAFDDRVVLNDLSFSVAPGSMTLLLGASGSGKTVLLKLVLGLLRPDRGQIFVNGRRIDDLGERDLLDVRADIGMLFQENALFDSLTVGENVGYRLDDAGEMSPAASTHRVEEVLAFMGLHEFIDRMPATLSGGQRKRVAIARAMAPRPNLLLLDDPTTGLDPILATTVDDEIVKLRDLEHTTAILVTHQIRDAFYIATHEAIRTPAGIQIVSADAAKADNAEFMVLHDGRIQFEGTAAALMTSADPYLRSFLYKTLPPW
jgi:phospholipid/cholesterol/gamma-HCH transport system ATP-binding protein